MAEHRCPCDVCDQIALCVAGEHPRLVAELGQTWVVMGPHQKWPGYVVLLCKQAVTELHELDSKASTELMAELVLVGKAVQRATKAHKLNTESLGNVCPHLHWHIFPRQSDEPGAHDPVWVQMADAAEYAFEAGKHSALRDELANQITSRPS